MATKAVYIPVQLHQELKALALEEGKTLTELVSQFLREAIDRERSRKELKEQEKLWAEIYREMAQEHARMAEESVRYVVEVLDPAEDWREYENE